MAGGFYGSLYPSSLKLSKFKEVKMREVLPVQYNVFQDNVSNLIPLLSVTSPYISDIKSLLDNCQCKKTPSQLIPLTCCDIVNELSVNCNSPLHIACKVGNLGYARIQNYTQYVEVTNKDGDTPLHIACRFGHKEICKYIIKWSAGSVYGNYVKRDHYWGKVIRTPCTYYSKELDPNSYVNILISSDFPCMLARNKENKTPFQVALQCGKYSCMKIITQLPVFHFILSLKSMILISLSGEDWSDMTGYTTGVVMLSGHLYHKYVKECIEIAHDYEQNNYTQIVAHIGFCQHLKNDTGQYPIETLIKNSDKNYAVLKKVINFSPYFLDDMINSDYNKFYNICKRLEFPQFNREIWNDLRTKQDREGSLLHYICRYGSIKNVTLLISYHDINTQNKSGDTLLWVAYSSKNFMVCSWLVLNEQCDIYSYGKDTCNADIEILCQNILVPEFEVTEVIPGDTLLHAAAASGASQAISFLVRWIKLNKLNSKQQYPLHVACKSGLSIEAIHLLRECDITHKDIDGNTPLDLLYKYHPYRHDLMACAMGSSYYIPGVTPSPCSEEELVSTEWFRDLKFNELEAHQKLQNNVLHIAAENNTVHLILELKNSYLQLFNKYLSEKNVQHDLPIHKAVLHPNVHCVQLVSEGCDVNTVNVCGHTPLHEVCKNAEDSEGYLEVVIFLIEKRKLNMNICDQRGRSVLHLACSKGNYKIVNYILTKTNANINLKDHSNCTPLMLTSLDRHDLIKLLIEHGADTSYLYDTYKEFFKRYQSETPPPTPLNIIVAGKPSSGKSTLIKALCSDGNETIVEAEPHTAGIIPSSHHGDQLGCVSFYDLAGQSEYYASHEAVLHTVMASSTPLILLLIDSRKDQGLIQQDILYWLHFFKCQLPATSRDRAPHVIPIFSFVDLIPDQLAEKKLHCSKKFMSLLFTKTKFSLVNVSFLDCRASDSEDIKHLRCDIHECASVLRESAPIDFLLHCFYAFLLHSFKEQPAVRICDIVDIKEQWISSGIDPNVLSPSGSVDSLSSWEEFDVENEPTFEEENPAKLLPDNTKHFLKLSKRLHQKGHIIFIENRNNVKQSWLIINREILLHEINGSLFAPSIFQHCRGVISTSTGVVAASTIANHFDEKYNLDMLIGFLLHLEYCQHINDKFILELLTTESSYDSDEYYYFPGLVTLEKPQDVWTTPTESITQCCWILRVGDVKSFYTPRLIQVLLLRVAFQNAFPVRDWQPGFECPSICRSCSVWKNGIFWRNRTGIECLLEVTEESQAIVFMLRSLTDNLHSEILKEFLLMRSILIKTITNCVEEICPILNTVEYFCHPDYVQNPIKHYREIGLYSMENIARAICQRLKSVQCDNPRYENLTLSKLLYFDPFMHCCFKQLFDYAHQNETIGDNGVQIINAHIRNGQHSDFYVNLLSHEDNDEEKPFSISLDEELFKWKERSYQEFRLHLSQFSIFAERDPQTLGKCLVKQHSTESSDIVKKSLCLNLEDVFLQLFPELVERLQYSIHSIADSCVSNYLISQETYKEIIEMNLTSADKTRKLLMNLKKNISSKQGAVEKFCRVLTKHELDDVAKSFEQALQ